jgi:Flp pilus assembly pilin Flp
MAFVALTSAALFMGAGGSISGIWTTSNNQLSQANTMAS